eukprot:3284716-Rhodomonas_salina.3
MAAAPPRRGESDLSELIELHELRGHETPLQVERLHLVQIYPQLSTGAPVGAYQAQYKRQP